MNLILLGIIVILLIICIILLILLVNKNKNTSNIINKNNIRAVNSKINILDLEIPQKIEEMGHHALFQSCIKVYESFKALDYVSQLEKKLDDVEWHSWQISLLLALLQTDKEFFIPNPKKVIHASIFNKSNSYIENEMQKILVKYQENVNINKTRDELSKDVIWSCKEVSIIFYYMLINK